MSSTSDSWFAAANGQPEWLMWGKARPDGDIVAHPLICHMLDVTAVAAELLDSYITHAPNPEFVQYRAWWLFQIAMHDIGKISPAFQQKWPPGLEHLTVAGFDFNAPRNALHHGQLTLPLAEQLVEAHLSCSPEISRSTIRAVAAHHGSFPTDTEVIDIAEAIAEGRGSGIGHRELGISPLWQQARIATVELLKKVLGPISVPPGPPANAMTMWLAGLTSVADWIGSMTEHFPYVEQRPDPIEYFAIARRQAVAALNAEGFTVTRQRPRATFVELFGNQPWPLHEATQRVGDLISGPALIVIEAPMGEGKTEAALLLESISSSAGFAGAYIGLPTKATANQIFGRVQRFLNATRTDELTNLQLTHGDASITETSIRGICDEHAPAGAGVRAASWFKQSKRALVAAWGVGTVDQALLGVLRTKHHFVRLYGLAGKTVILDEVHAYDTYTSTIIDRLVEWLSALGARVVILSATLPSERLKALVKAWNPNATWDAATYPRITAVDSHQCSTHLVVPRKESIGLKLLYADDDHVEVASSIATSIANGGCIAWICNTVVRSQDAYAQLKELKQQGHLPEDCELLLFHSRFTRDERAKRERWLEAKLGRTGERPRCCIVVGTQVLEQSLDVDFDAMWTDLAPVDLLLQRSGRVHRHARTGRPSEFCAATMTIVSAANGEPRFREIGFVYVPYVMAKTWAVLNRRADVVIPNDIEPLVEAVYTALPLGEREKELHSQFVQERAKDESKAKSLLFGRPSMEDPFCDSRSLHDEDDVEAHPTLRAATRLGDLSLNLVCLHRVGSWLYFDALGTLPVPDRMNTDVVKKLLLQSVTVASPNLVRALMKTEVPPRWKEIASLRSCRMIELVAGRAVVDDWALCLDGELGLVTSKDEE